MIKVVADTNIYISALFWHGNPYKFIHLCFEGKARLVISRQIIDELGDRYIMCWYDSLSLRPLRSCMKKN